MSSYHFNRTHEGDLIIIKLVIDGKHEFKMLLDTGASHTTIDRNALYMFDYRCEDAIDNMYIETAIGVIAVDVVEVASLSALGVKREQFRIQVYDFLAHGILSDYDGMLGLDFFELFDRELVYSAPFF
jgi:predicted aspartyl protease